MNGFIKKIVEKENRLLLELKNISDPEKCLYIYGGGKGADNVEQLLLKNHIKWAGRLVNKKYASTDKVGILEDVLKEKEIYLIIAFNGYRPNYNGKNIKRIYNFDCWSGMDRKNNPVDISYNWVRSNESKIEDMYIHFEDDLSRKTLIAYLNQKISMKYGFMESIMQENQYFSKDIIHFNENEVFVDCGAYDGDTASAFVENMGDVPYKKIISFEPDPANYKKLVDRNIKNHICLEKGCSNENKVLKFSMNATSSLIDSDGGISIEVDSLDNAMSENVTYIKMDIEGEELKALCGAENTIRANHPKLAICVYHKKNDLLDIYSYIKKLNIGYKFYLRGYMPTTTELVLYAI